MGPGESGRLQEVLLTRSWPRAMLIGMVDVTSMLWAWVVSSKPELDGDYGRVDESQGDP
jgi:hypothetical protein